MSKKTIVIGVILAVILCIIFYRRCGLVLTPTAAVDKQPTGLIKALTAALCLFVN